MRRRERGRVRGPLAAFAPGFRAHLAGLGFASVSARHRIRQLDGLSRWMEIERLEASDLTAAQAERYLAARRASGQVGWVSPACLTLPLEYLRSIGVAPAPAEVAVEGPVEQLLGAYRSYLAGERGLAAGTMRAYLRIARSFCLSGAMGPGGDGQLCAADVTAFVVATCSQSSTALAKKTVTALASLLRFLHVAGVTADSLCWAVPKVAGRRSGAQSRGLEATEVARLLSSCDRRRAAGRRDYAILTLLERFGLRAAEVAALTLDDVDWHHGDVVIRGKGDRHERLPLPHDVGEALAGYLRHGRARTPRDCRALFLRTIPPAGPLGPGGIRAVVRSAARRAGLPTCGPHRLRHFAATATLRHGAPLPEVARLLRHRSLQVAAAYAQIDPAALRELARPWPGGAA